MGSGLRHITIQTNDAACRGKIKLRLSGFWQQSLVSNEKIIEALERLPNGHIVGLREIEYDPARETQKFYAYYLKQFRSMSAKGEFLSDRRRVVVYDFESLQQFYHVLYHELGHYVFYQVLSSEQRKEWVTKLFKHYSSVTVYGSRNASEDFAESYAVMLTKPEDLKKISAKYRFMLYDVFKSSVPSPIKNTTDFRC